MPIDAILFGGRRASVVPLVIEARDWKHGTFLGSIMGSEKTAAAAGGLGQLRRDPMAMLPFCGYNMADYFKHWLDMGAQSDAMPRIFYVNWFRKNSDGKWLWPGFGENSRVLKWIVERCAGKVDAVDTPIGQMPAENALDVSGLDLPAEDLAELLHVDVDQWLGELQSIQEHYAQFGERLPEGLNDELKSLEERLKASK